MTKRQLVRDERAVRVVLARALAPISAPEIFLRGGELREALQSLVRKGEVVMTPSYLYLWRGG
jgi:hypothetical protein